MARSFTAPGNIFTHLFVNTNFPYFLPFTHFSFSSAAKAVCSPVQIPRGHLDFSQNATSNRYLQGTTATIHCNESTVPNTAVISSTCNDQGHWPEWDLFAPACMPPCPTLNLGTNLTVSTSNPSLGVGTKATFNCDSGFSLNGSQLLTCTEKSVWSGKTPSCTSELKCNCNSKSSLNVSMEMCICGQNLYNNIPTVAIF